MISLRFLAACVIMLLYERMVLQRWVVFFGFGEGGLFAFVQREMPLGHSRATPPQWGVRRRRKWQVNVNTPDLA